jgi:hypothetical protein
MKSNQNKNNHSQDNNNEQYGNLYWQYNYYNAMLKSSVNYNNMNNASALRESQQNMQKMSNKIRQSEMDILNRCILEKDNLTMSTQFKNMEELFKKWTSGQKNRIKRR